MLEILKNKKLQINLAIILASGLIILFGVIYSLKSFTRHGESITVPNFVGYSFKELQDKPEFKHFKFSIADSIYDPYKEKGSIVMQDPKQGAVVKEGRNVYITVVSVNPEMIEMPNLIDLSYRNASSLIETYGFRIVKITYVPDIAKNAVLAQKYKGQPIEPGTSIPRGSAIELVLGEGTSNDLVKVPLFIGLTHSEMQKIIHNASLNIGEEHFEPGDDTSSVRIYRQIPEYTNSPTATMGQTIEFWYKSDKNFNFKEFLKTVKPADEMQDSNAIQ